MRYPNNKWMMPRKDRVPFWVHREVHTQLKELSKETSKPMLILVDEILRRYFKRKKK